MTKDARLVKKMDNYLREKLNNREIFISWLYVVPDGATDNDYQDIAEDRELFNNVVKLFAGLLILDNE